MWHTWFVFYMRLQHPDYTYNGCDLWMTLTSRIMRIQSVHISELFAKDLLLLRITERKYDICVICKKDVQNKWKWFVRVIQQEWSQRRHASKRWVPYSTPFTFIACFQKVIARNKVLHLWWLENDQAFPYGKEDWSYRYL